MHEHFSEHHMQHRAEYHHLDRKSDKRCNCGEYILQRICPELRTDVAGRVRGRDGFVASEHVAVRGDVDIQAASAVGSFVWSSGAGCGGNVGMQQFAKIAGRNGNEAGAVSVGCDGHGAEWSGLKRELDAERPTVAEGRLNSVAPGKRGFLWGKCLPGAPDANVFGFGVAPFKAGCKGA
jgi:hypothetical protein